MLQQGSSVAHLTTRAHRAEELGSQQATDEQDFSHKRLAPRGRRYIHQVLTITAAL